MFTPANLVTSSTMILSTFLAMSSSNWLLAWVSMEINLLSFIPLMISSMSNKETEASVKYFLAQALGSAIMLLSSISLWHSNISHSLAMMTLIMSLLIKLGAAPCHFWFPSVMTSLSWLNCLILATWQKLAPLILLCYPTMYSSSLQSIIPPLAMLNALVGGILGMNQSHMRTILAYSSITHMGWMISALSINTPHLTMWYLAMYSMIIGPMFIIFHIFSTTLSSQLSSLFKSSKYSLPLVSLLLMSLAGLPPLTGFLPKWLMISYLISYNNSLVMILLLGSFLNLYFYLTIMFNSMTSEINLTSFTTTSPLSLPLFTMSALALLGLAPIMFYALTMFN